MAKTITLYQCSYCDHTLKTKKGIAKHEKTCSDNPNTLKIKESIEHIRCEATSVDDLIVRLKDFLLSLGIKLHLQKYPSLFNHSVKNSYAAPKGYKENWSGNPDVPKGYPGWTGTWSGELEVIDSSILECSSTPFFGHIVRGELRKELKLDFIKTGSGSFGSVFDCRGILFVYDFPKIHKKYLEGGGAISDLTEHYSEVVDTYANRLQAEQNTAVNEDYTLQKLKDLERNAIDLRKRIETEILRRDEHVRSEFVKNYHTPLPLPPDAFAVNESTSKIIQEVTSSCKAKPKPNLKVFTDRLDSLVAEMEKLEQNNPEYFL